MFESCLYEPYCVHRFPSHVRLLSRLCWLLIRRMADTDSAQGKVTTVKQKAERLTAWQLCERTAL